MPVEASWRHSKYNFSISICLNGERKKKNPLLPFYDFPIDEKKKIYID